MSILPAAFLLILAINLWVFAGRIGGWILGDLPDEPTKHTGYLELQYVLFSSIGLYILALAIPEIVNQILNIWLIDRVNSFDGTMTLMQTIQLIIALIKFIIGVSLFFGSKGLVKVISKLRNAGF